MNEPIVSAEWLKNNIDDPNLILLDASQQTNKSGISTDFSQLQIPKARIFDLQGEFSLKPSSLPNMLPTPEHFEKSCRKIGINKSSRIVVYDNLGTYFSPRAWWMFKTMGHEQISVLNGGLPDWISKGFSTEEKKPTEYESGDFCSSFQENSVKDFSFIENNIYNQEFLLVDARSSDRFNGTAPEPRKGILSGHIKNSINLPFDNVLENGKFKSKEELVKLFNNAKIDNRPLVFSCGSGITACIVLLACELICENKKSIYDGSWTEWALRTQNN